MNDINLLYIGSNLEFGKSLLREINSPDCINDNYIIDTNNTTILECLTNVFSKNDLNFNGYIIQLESRFVDHNIIETSPGMILIKNILLSEEHDIFRRKKLIALSFFPLHYHIKRNPDNVILLSPYVSAIDIIKDLKEAAEEIVHEIKKHLGVINEKVEDFEKDLNNYVFWTKEDEEKNKHEAQNYFGIQRIYRELYNENDSEYNMIIKNLLSNKNLEFADKYNELWFRKKRFKHRIDFLYPSREAEIDKKAKNQFDLDWVSPRKILIVDDKKEWIDFFRVLFKDAFIDSFDNFDEADKYFKNSDNNLNNKWKKELTQIKSLIENQSAVRIESNVDSVFDYDMIFIDLRLRNIDKNKNLYPKKLSGIQLLEKIKRINHSIPVIITTASENPKVIQEAVVKKCDGYFIKDRYMLSDLVEIVQENYDSYGTQIQKNLNLLCNQFKNIRKIWNSDSESILHTNIPYLTSHLHIDLRYSNKSDEGIFCINEMPIYNLIYMENLIELAIDELRVAIKERKEIKQIYFKRNVDKILQDVIRQITLKFFEFNFDYVKKDTIIESINNDLFKFLQSTSQINQFFLFITDRIVNVFNKYSGDKQIEFNDIYKYFDNTVRLLSAYKPVQAIVTKSNKDFYDVKILHTKFDGIVYINQIQKAGEDRTFNVGEIFSVLMRKIFHGSLSKESTFKLIKKNDNELLVENEANSKIILDYLAKQ